MGLALCKILKRLLMVDHNNGGLTILIRKQHRPICDFQTFDDSIVIIVYRPGYFTVHPPPPAPSGPKFSKSENCCGSENAMPPKIFWDMEGHRGNFR